MGLMEIVSNDIGSEGWKVGRGVLMTGRKNMHIKGKGRRRPKCRPNFLRDKLDSLNSVALEVGLDLLG